MDEEPFHDSVMATFLDSYADTCTDELSMELDCCVGEKSLREQLNKYSQHEKPSRRLIACTFLGRVYSQDGQRLLLL